MWEALPISGALCNWLTDHYRKDNLHGHSTLVFVMTWHKNITLRASNNKKRKARWHFGTKAVYITFTLISNSVKLEQWENLFLSICVWNIRFVWEKEKGCEWSSMSLLLRSRYYPQVGISKQILFQNVPLLQWQNTKSLHSVTGISFIYNIYYI